MYFRLTLGVLEMLYVYGIIEIDGLLLKSYFGLILSAVETGLGPALTVCTA